MTTRRGPTRRRMEAFTDQAGQPPYWHHVRVVTPWRYDNPDVNPFA